MNQTISTNDGRASRTHVGEVDKFLTLVLRRHVVGGEPHWSVELLLAHDQFDLLRVDQRLQLLVRLSEEQRERLGRRSFSRSGVTKSLRFPSGCKQIGKLESLSGR